jgi:hypothetical protein
MIISYEAGPIACKAAFTSDFDLAPGLPLQQVVTNLDVGRRKMDVRPGMRHKYAPLRFDPATGLRQSGGRYLFDTWENAVDYVRFTEELELEKGVKFWERPFFIGVDKLAWHVVGAYDFAPIAVHFAHRFERFEYTGEMSIDYLQARWTLVLEAAMEAGLASVWLLFQPDERQIGILTVIAQVPDVDAAQSASASLKALEPEGSLSKQLFFGNVRPRKIFDRSSVNLSVWLPQSRRAGGDAAVFPTYPVHPLPQPATETKTSY